MAVRHLHRNIGEGSVARGQNNGGETRIDKNAREKNYVFLATDVKRIVAWYVRAAKGDIGEVYSSAQVCVG